MRLVSRYPNREQIRKSCANCLACKQWQKICTSFDAKKKLSHGFLFHFLTFQNGVQKQRERNCDCSIMGMVLRENIAFVSLNLWPESLLSGRNELCEKMAQYLRKSKKKKWKDKSQKDNRKKFSSRTTIQKQNIGDE